MSTSRLAGTPVVWVLGIAGLLLAACGDGGGGGSAEADVDLSKLPDPGPVLREHRNADGTRVMVLAEGTGEPAASGDLVDVRYHVRGLDGATVDEGTIAALGLVPVRPKRPGHPLGAVSGGARMRVGERRRVVVPARHGWVMGAGHDVQPGSAPVVVDLERIPTLVVGVLELRPSVGDVAKIGDTIVIHYRGKLKDGTVFDASYDRGKPNEFKLERGGLIEGWIRGVAGMRVGSSRLLRVPAALAYGRRGNPPKIPADSDLVFEVELEGIK
jgi:FKBP-type peptidyl-prolyl cis-trans isomerase